MAYIISLSPLERVFRSRKAEVWAKSRRQRISENAFLDAVGLVRIPQVSQLIYPSLVAIDINDYH